MAIPTNRNRTQRKRKPNRLKIWNEDLKEAIKKKKKAYLCWLNSSKLQDHIEYKQQRATVRKLTRQVQKESWEQFVKRLEKDLTGRQKFGFKIFKNLNSEITDNAKLNIIPDEKWITYYKQLLVNEDQSYETDTKNINELNAIKMIDLDQALKNSKNRKAPGSDCINTELIKYASLKWKKRFVQLLNDIWNEGRIPDEWKVAKNINIHKKGVQIIEESHYLMPHIK